jgi:PKD repeat protein
MKTNSGNESGQKRFRRAVFFSTSMILCLAVFTGLGAADDWIGGLPLTTVQNGTVSGDLWFDAAPAPDWGENVVTKTFTLPEAAVAGPGRITWARLYISAYCGHMQSNYTFSIINSWDGDNDGIYEQVWSEPGQAAFQYLLDENWNDLGNDNTALGGGAHDPYKKINDHENRVTSDYFMWYNVTDMIENQTVNVNVNTSGSYDGRIKVITLVVAYNDPSSSIKTSYWVNQGHDVCSYYTENKFEDVAVGSTTFSTTGLSGVISATLTVDYMASSNGAYGFPTIENDFNATTKTGNFINLQLDTDPDEQGAYSGLDSWNVTSSVTGSSDATLGYARDLSATGTSAFYKIPLAFLVVKSPFPPVANFSGNLTQGDAPLTVSFTDNSTNNPTSWAWDFGDGTGSAEQNPVHKYVAAGTYTVKLTVANAGGNGTEIKTNYITAKVPVTPVAEFNASPLSGTIPLKVQFTDNSTNNPTSWVWDFGDRKNSTEQNPAHNYTEVGNYTVKLTVANAAGNGTEKKIEYITANPPIVPVAAFNASPLFGTAPLKVQFTDNSTNNPTSWVWDFGDGENSTEQNPSHIYASAGSYTVKLTVATTAGKDEELKEDYITVIEPSPDLFISALTPEAEICANISCTIGATIGNIGTGDAGTFNATLSVNGTEVDSKTASGLVKGGNVSVDFSWTPKAVGNYSLMVTADSENSVTESNETNNVLEANVTAVLADAPIAAFTANVTSGTAPLSVNFTDLSIGKGITVWAWDFGDGNTSTEQNPNHTYTAEGNYTVKLRVANEGGMDEEIKAAYIIVTLKAVPALSIEVSPSTLDFGRLSPGKTSAPLELTLKNAGTSNINVTVEVSDSSSEDKMFSSGIYLDEDLWKAYEKTIEYNNQTNTEVTLMVPSGSWYGTYGGTITFWAESAD